MEHSNFDQLRSEFEALRRAHEAQSKEIYLLRQRDQSMDAATAQLKAGNERERFLLEELRVINDRILCEFSRRRSLLVCCLVWPLVDCAVVCCDHELEGERVHDRLRDRVESMGSESGFFWMDHRREANLATLQDRMDQAEALVERCWSALQPFFTTMDPLGQAPSSIFELVEFFRQNRGSV